MGGVSLQKKAAGRDGFLLASLYSALMLRRAARERTGRGWRGGSGGVGVEAGHGRIPGM